MNKLIYSHSKNDWLYIFFIMISILTSVFLRDPFMHRISSFWRSSQTLLTSFWFQKEGISLFHSQLPLFGPPWKVPFEFPLYQAMSVVFSNMTHLNLTAASRVVSVACFYLSAILLLLLCHELLNNKTLSAIIFIVYIFLPYNIIYSTEILIDYFAVALALGYLFLIKKFLDSPRDILLFILATIFGCLGAVVKITTMAITIIPAILIVLDGIQRWGIKLKNLTTLKGILVKIRKQKYSFMFLVMIAIFPILSVKLWTNFSDGIKQANVFTAWLTSVNLTGWNYGTLDQKTSFVNWMNWFVKINNFFLLGGLLLIFLLLGIFYLYRMPFKSRCFFGTAFVGSLLTIFIFFNLYSHEYYYIAISPYICSIIGFGIYSLIKFLLPQKNWWIAFGGIYFFLILFAGLEQYRAFQADIREQIDFMNTKIIPLAKKAAAVTPENEYIISFQSDWFPDFMLYSKRKGLVISPREYGKYSCDLVNKYDYSTIVLVDVSPDMSILHGMSDCFRSFELVEPGIYKVKP